MGGPQALPIGMYNHLKMPAWHAKAVFSIEAGFTNSWWSKSKVEQKLAHLVGHKMS
jgi:hypothetical protein